MMWSGLVTLGSNLGMSLEYVSLLLVILGSIIFMAKDFKIGIIMLLITSGCGFALFYELSMNYVPFLVVFFMCLAILSLTLLLVNKSVERGSFI